MVVTYLYFTLFESILLPLLTHCSVATSTFALLCQ